MGMLGTVINGVAMQEALEYKGLSADFKQLLKWNKLQNHLLLEKQWDI